MKKTRLIALIIAFLVQSIWLLSCSSPKVLYKSTQAVDFDSLANAFTQTKDIHPRKSLIVFGNYRDKWYHTSFMHMIQKNHDTLLFHYRYKTEGSLFSLHDKYSSSSYSIKVIDPLLTRKTEKWLQKPLVRIDDLGRYGFSILALPVTAQKQIFITMDGYRFNNHKKKGKFRQTRALFKRIAKRYYDIPKQYIKY